jgi:hypothetical protein
MKLVGLAVKEVVKQSQELVQLIGTKFYNGIAPQKASYPFVVGRVSSVTPVDSKAYPGVGRACTDTYGYMVSVFDHDLERCGRIASKCRKVLDRPRPGMYYGMQLNMMVFKNAEEDAIATDDGDVFCWHMYFEIRMDFSTDEI